MRVRARRIFGVFLLVCLSVESVFLSNNTIMLASEIQNEPVINVPEHNISDEQGTDEDSGLNMELLNQDGTVKEEQGQIVPPLEADSGEVPPEGTQEYILWKEHQAEEMGKNNIQHFSLGYTGETIENEYLSFHASGSGYWIGTSGGDPENAKDDYQTLIFGSGSTSYTTVRIDGRDYTFSPDAREREGDEIIGTATYDGIRITQHIRFCDNQYTKRADVIEFYYEVVNTKEEPHNIGIRIMFDTMLGDNDEAPFRLPNLGDVTTETDLRGEEIPEFWQAFDSLSNPSVISQGTLKTDEASTPDRVRFTNWRNASIDEWDYYRKPMEENGDSAVCLYWEKELANNETLKCKTYYGLSALQQDMRPPLTMAISGAAKIEIKENQLGKEEYSPNPFTITAYIQNISNAQAENVKTVLTLPEGFELTEGTRETALGNIPADMKQYQVSWKVKVLPGFKDRIEKYSVTLSADHMESKTLERELTIPKLSADAVKIQVDRTLLDSHALMKIKLLNTGSADIPLDQILIRYFYGAANDKQALSASVGQIDFRGWYMDQKELLLRGGDSGIADERANKMLTMEFQNKEVLKAREEIVLHLNVYRKDFEVIRYPDYYSGLAEGASQFNKNIFVDWETINVWNKETDQLIWGSEPTAETMYCGNVFEKSNLAVESQKEILFDQIKIQADGNLCEITGKLKPDDGVRDILIKGNISKVKDNKYIIIPEGDTAGLNILYVGFMKDFSKKIPGKEGLLHKDIIEIAFRDKEKDVIYYFINEVSPEWMELIEINSKMMENERDAMQYLTWYFDYSYGSDANMTPEYVENNVKNVVNEIQNTLSSFSQEEVFSEQTYQNIYDKTGIATLGFRNANNMDGVPASKMPYGLSALPENVFTMETKDRFGGYKEYPVIINANKHKKIFIYWNTVKPSTYTGASYSDLPGAVETQVIALSFTQISDQEFHATPVTDPQHNFTIDLIANHYVVTIVGEKDKKAKKVEIIGNPQNYYISDLVAGVSVSDGSMDSNGKKTANLYLTRVGINSRISDVTPFMKNKIKNLIANGVKYIPGGKIISDIIDSIKSITDWYPFEKGDDKDNILNIHRGDNYGDYAHQVATNNVIRTHAIKLEGVQRLVDGSSGPILARDQGDYIELYTETACGDDYTEKYKNNRRGKMVMFLDFNVYNHYGDRLYKNNTMSFEIDLKSPEVSVN